MVDLARWRDAALILLALEALLLGLLLAAATYLGLRGVLRFHERVRPVLSQGHTYTRQIRKITRRIMNVIAAPFVWLQSTIAGLCRTLATLGRR